MTISEQVKKYDIEKKFDKHWESIKVNFSDQERSEALAFITFRDAFIQAMAEAGIEHRGEIQRLNIKHSRIINKLGA